MDALKKQETQVASIATAWLIKDKENFLLFKRNTKSGFGQWAFPGGKMDTTDQTVYHAATRELKEETGLDNTPNNVPFFPIFTKSQSATFITFIFILEVEDVQVLNNTIKQLNVVNKKGELSDIKILSNSEMFNISHDITTFNYTKGALISYLAGGNKLLTFNFDYA